MSANPAQQFWDHVASGEVRMQRCDSCATFRFPPSEVCHKCLSPQATWVACAGLATLLSWIVVHDGPAAYGPFPYISGHAELSEGVRYTAYILGGQPDELRAGLPMRLVLGPVRDQGTMPHLVVA